MSHSGRRMKENRLRINCFSECFWRVRSGCGVPPEVVRKTLVAQGLGECEAECVETHLFTCRSFVYR